MTNTHYTSSATSELQNIQFQIKDIRCDQIVSETKSNWAFLDMQNLYQGVQERRWRINWRLFREYLLKEYDVVKAIIFMGYLKENSQLYSCLESSGFLLEFRKVKRLGNGTIEGGNVDADLASYIMDYKNDYNKAIIVADDGDYCRTIKSLDRQDKLKLIISSHSLKETSDLIKSEVARKLLLSIHSIRNIIEYKN